MAKCDQCGNDYDKSFQVSMNGRTYTFDCFECAIAVCAPTCDQCGVKIVGHGMESGDLTFCCANCARTAGVKGLVDDARRVSMR